MRHPLMPADTPDYMVEAWASCILWASKNPQLLKEFLFVTGIKNDALPEDFMEEFIKWVNINVWGPMDYLETSKEEPLDDY